MRKIIALSALLLSGCQLLGDIDGTDKKWSIDPSEDMQPDKDMSPDMDMGSSDLDTTIDMPDLTDASKDISLEAPTLMVNADTKSIVLTWNSVDGAKEYEVKKDNGQWVNVGMQLTWADQNASGWTISSVNATASIGASRTEVQLGATPVYENAKMHTYQVRAIGGPSSNNVSASRLQGDCTTSWERADTADGAFSGINAPDVNAPISGDARYYRALVLCEGANEGRLSSVVEGRLLAVKSIHSGDDHHCAQLTNGEIKCWGKNENGVLGIGSTTPVGISMADFPIRSLQWPTLNGAQLSNSFSHSMCAVKAGVVSCWGNHAMNQIGPVSKSIGITDQDMLSVLTFDEPAKHVELGLGHGCALLANDTMSCWGQNSNGVLGRNLDDPYYGDVLGDYPLSKNVVSSNVLDFAVGLDHVCVRYKSNDVACFGKNNEGQLGIGNANPIGTQASPFTGQTTISNAKAVFAGRSHSCIINNRNKAQCWGGNSNGELGIGVSGAQTNVGDEQSEMPPAEIALTGSVVDMTLGHGFTCALIQSGDVYCWGANNNGIVANGTNTDTAQPTTKVGLPNKARQISSAAGSICALLDDGQVYCWGYNFEGQLGLGFDFQTLDNWGDNSNEHPTTPVKLW